MAEIITLNYQNNFNYSISLNGNTYFFRVYWNSYIGRWCLDIRDVNDNYVAMGLVIVANINILRYSQQLTNNFGEIRCYDFTGSDCEIREDLGVNIFLVYYEPGEYDELFPQTNKIVQREINYDFYSFFTVA